MKRTEFLQMCTLFGISIPFQASLLSCSKDDTIGLNFSGKVTIIGAGAGGLAAGYLLKQQGIDFEILEASAVYGGRMKINTDFADFPIPLGAEWLETGSNIFQEIVNDSSITVHVDTIADAPDLKFVNSSWFSFFEQYILPSISDKIVYNKIVQSIDYSGDQIIVNMQSGQHMTDKVIVSVPLKILQDGDISFTPNLPQDKLNAISGTTIWEGFKAFFEFSEKFYDDNYEFGITPSTAGEKIYYNAAFGQNTTKHILGLFVVGTPALDFTSLSGDALRDFILNELNGIYSNQATPNYIKHITQDWDNEPFIKGGYMTDNADWRTVKTLGESVANKIYFAGGAYTDGEDWVSVHAAAQSAKSVVDVIIN
ncbi:flavin monoamine oxidase family protein [Lacinutrix jangbogonensis]|uniref:flavin monoamine oxidase family protein n=1 Tax=Lacinutrix jangbogonensis TaxID=1469557 RepID=UPI0006907BAD|nr:FAD-dependent oxidoreductase [Lacinutrix jangbogonensis]